MFFAARLAGAETEDAVLDRATVLARQRVDEHAQALVERRAVVLGEVALRS
jgi:hypothetical protein